MDLISAFSAIHKMSTTQRYSNTHLAQREDILSHTGSVTMLVASMVTNFTSNIDLMIENYGTSWTSPDAELLISRALLKSVVHDVEEVITGDIVRPVKYHSPEMLEQFKSLESVAAQSVLKDLGFDSTAFTVWDTAKSGLSGTFVKVADIISVVYKIYTECVMCGTYSILKACPEMHKYLHEISQYIEKVYKPSEKPLTYKFFYDIIRDSSDLLSTVEAGCPRLATFGK